MAGAGDRVCHKLYLEIARLIGTAGFQALFARSLHLAKVEAPLLNGIEVVSGNGVRLEGMRDAVQGKDPTEVSRALAVLFGSFIWLLSTFIGKDLALRLVRQVWPEIPLGETDSGSEEVEV